MLFYKGFYGSTAYSEEDKVWHGKLEGIPQLVLYSADEVEDLEYIFREAVEDYLETQTLIKYGH